MNPFFFAVRRPVTTLMLAAGLAAGGEFALNKVGVNVLQVLDEYKSKIPVVLGYFGPSPGQTEQKEEKEEHHSEQQELVVTSPEAKDVVITQSYVCQIHSRQHIEVCANARGYLQKILVSEGQEVKKGDLMFKILPVLYKARLDAENAEAKLAQLEFNFTKNLADPKLPVVSRNEVALLEAKLKKAQAKAQLAQAEFDFTEVTAHFDGIVDRQLRQLGSLIEEGDVLTTLSDNSVMWVYFNVWEKRYLEYMAETDEEKADQRIELVLADGSKFPEAGKIATIEAKFNNETGNIPFRADFPNPKRLLRHGQTGTLLIHRTLKDAIVIPQRATFELLDKRYVYVVGEDQVARQRLITIKHELEDTFVIESGLDVKDRIVLEGAREVRDGYKVEYEYREPEEVLADQKYHAE